MKIAVTILLIFFSWANLLAQNYFSEYPINVSIASNGQQSRLECSTFDSLLQTTIYYQTDWFNGSILVSSNAYGKVGFTTWTTPVDQNPLVGFVMYDQSIHAFTYQLIPVDLSGNKKANVVCGRIWITVAIEYPQSGYFYYEGEHYRYNMIFHSWIKCRDSWFENNSNIWNFPAKGNTDVAYEWENENHRYVDPISNEVKLTEEVCSTNNIFTDDYIAIPLGCSPGYSFLVYDAETHIYEKYPSENLEGTEQVGIFWAADDSSNSKKYFFTYDQAIHQWVTDSVESPYLTGVLNRDRIITYIDSTAGYSKKVFYMAYHPVQHAWLKDSSAISGNITNHEIQDGTVKWVDSNGMNIRGYVDGSGWGNYSTTPFLHFYLTDFSQQGYPMVHVRNYSIGIDSVYYDFGDGTISLNNRHVLWHSYITTGNFTICLKNLSGMQSSCQQVSMNLCASAGLISFSNDTLCSGDTLTLSILNFNGAIQWQKKTGSVWVDEPGSNDPLYVFVPTQTATYRTKVTNGLCIPAYSNEQTIKVYEGVGNPYLSDSLLTKCSNASAKIVVLNAAPNVTYKWQSNSGSGWLNINNATNSSYNAGATVNLQYRAIVSSGLCFADTTEILSVNVETAPAVPVTTPGYTCGPGYATLYSSGAGSMHWYRSSPMDSILHIGNFYSPYITVSTGFKVKASSGIMTTAGYSTTSIGATGVLSNEKKGIRFYTSAPGTFEYFYIYPLQSGVVRISLYNTTNNEIVWSVNKQVTAGTGAVKLWANTYLVGNMTYDLVVLTGSIPLEINTTGMNYPVTSGGSPVTITGYVDSVFHNTGGHYNFYDMHISTACKSAASSTVMANLEAAFNIASITPAGPTTFCQGESVVLNAFNNPNFGYTWLRNGVIAATSGSSYTAFLPGSYTLIMNNSFPCYDTSASVNVIVPCVHLSEPGEKSEIATGQTENLNFFYNAAADEIIIGFPSPDSDSYFLSIMDQSGRTLLEQRLKPDVVNGVTSINIQKFSTGIYVVKIQSERRQYAKRFFKS